MTEVKVKKKNCPPPPPLGNKRALGNEGGRPRTVSPPPEDLIALGKEMIEFVLDRKNKVLHITEFWLVYKGFTEKQWDTFQERPEFITYYKQAIKIIGKRYLDGTVNASIAQRWLRSYYQDLTKREDNEAKADAALRKEIEGVKPTHITLQVTHDGLASGLNVSAEALPDSID